MMKSTNKLSVWVYFALRCALLGVVCTSFSTISQAQVSGKAFDGFKSGSKDPIKIDANELEVLDSQNKAIFKGKVKVRQGSSLLTTDKLTAFYARGGSSGKDGIDRLVFVGNVVVSSGANTATANEGSYNVKTQIVVLSGNVLISQGNNAARGKKLVANLGTNRAKLTGRPSMIFTPSK